MSSNGDEVVRVEAGALERFVEQVLATLGVPRHHAQVTAEVLVRADVTGIDSHGVSRLGLYVHKLTQGLVNPNPEPKVVRDAGAVLVIDADNGLGPIAGRMAIDACIERARTTGIACASVGHSNHYGIAGYYALRAVGEAMIGVSMTNATSIVAPTFGAQPMFGTNPIAVGVPAGEERPFLFDAATSAVAVGKLELAAAAGEDIPEGWAIDQDGATTTNPGLGMMGALMPLGGSREQGGHKGYGLAVVVDILSALLSGAASGPNCLSLTSEFDQVADVGHFFAALSVEAFWDLDEFRVRMDDLIRGLRATPTAPGDNGVLVAGDPEFDVEIERTANGIPLKPHVQSALANIAAERGIADAYEVLVRR